MPAKADERLLAKQRQYLTTLHEAGLYDDEAFAAFLTLTGSPYSRPSATQWRNGKTPMPAGALLALDAYHDSRDELVRALRIRATGRAVQVTADAVAEPAGKTEREEGAEAMNAAVHAFATAHTKAEKLAAISIVEREVAEWKAAALAMDGLGVAS